MTCCETAPRDARRGTRSFAKACLAASLSLSVAAATASPLAGHRSFPAHALRGELVLSAPPLALVDGTPVRLAPGARIRGEDNLQRLPGALLGQTLLVHYTVEAATGLLMDVWILNSAERANSPWPSTAQEGRQWRFEPASQRWSRP